MALLQALFNALMGVQMELTIFVFALCIHALLFRSRRFEAQPLKPKRPKEPTPEKAASLSRKGGSDGPPVFPSLSVALARSAKKLSREGAGQEKIAVMFEDELKGSSPESACDTLVGMLEQAGRAVNVEILAAMHKVAHKRGLASARFSELLLQKYLGMRLKAEFAEVLAEVEDRKETTPGIAALALRASLASSDLEAALRYLRPCFCAVKLDAAAASPSVAPKQLMQQLMQLAAQKAAVPAVLQELRDSGLLTASTLETALVGYAQAGDGTALQQTERFARSEGLGLTDVAYGALVQGAGTAEDALRLFTEATERGLAGKNALMAAARRAILREDASLAAVAAQRLRGSPEPELASALIRLYSGGLLAGKDTDAALLSVYTECLTDVDVLEDVRAGWLVAEAALRSSRPDVIAQLVSGKADASRQVALLKMYGSERRLKDATLIFRSCPEKTANLYNALLAVCMDCQEMDAADQLMAEAVAAGKADVVTYNIMIKKDLLRGDLEHARAAIETMRSAGGSLVPNCATFNELIDATIQTNLKGAWALLEDMGASGLRPNNFTYSTLLKGIKRPCHRQELERLVALVDDMDDAMDDVLLSSLCEACIRSCSTDTLRRQLKRYRGGRGRVNVNGAHSYGSLVRAYGFLKDLDGAWGEWREMRARHIVPTTITTGCMVEALVSNGDPDAGHALICELRCEEHTRTILNSVIYSSVIKGFSHQKRFDSAWTVYHEMLEQGVELSSRTYNALIDACVRNGQMARVPTLMKDMARQKIDPDLVTCGTIIKGHCQEKNMEKALELFGTMKKSGKFRPDEVIYNILIDGCALQGLFGQGMTLLKDMQEAGVPPSAFTLSVLVKLATRSGWPDKAFTICETLSRKHNIQLNMHVYNNLIHACTASGNMQRAMRVFEEMMLNKVHPDVRTYSLLLRGCLRAGATQDVAGLLRAAFGLRGAHPGVANSGAAMLELRDGLPAELLSDVLRSLARNCGEERLAEQLRSDITAHQAAKHDGRQRRP